MASRKNFRDCLQSRDSDSLRVLLGSERVGQSELDEGLRISCLSDDPNLVDVLVEFGANPNVSDLFGTTVLHFAARGGRENVIIALIRNGAVFDDWLSDGENLLHWACHSGFLRLIDFILTEFNQTVNDTDKNGRRLLHLACLYSQPKIVNYLLKRNDVDINQTDANGWSPLHYACSDSNEGNQSDIISMLVKHNVDILITTPSGKTAIDVAYECGHENALTRHLSLAEILRLLTSIDNIIPSIIATTPSAEFPSLARAGKGVNLSIWRKILQNDDVEILDTLKESGVLKVEIQESFERAQKITATDMTDLFNECYENGLAVYSYIKTNFKQEILNGDFRGILECLTGLNGFEYDEVDGLEIFESPYDSLTFLAFICGRFRVVDHLLRLRQFDLLPMGLLITLIARRLEDDKSFPDQFNEAVIKFADSTERLLVDALNRILIKDNSVGNKVTLDALKLPMKSYTQLSLIDLADKAKCTSFLCLPCCQSLLDERWYGKLSNMTTRWRLLTTIFPFLLIVHTILINSTSDFKNRLKHKSSSTVENQNVIVIRDACHFQEKSFFKRILYVTHAIRSPSVKCFYHSLFFFVFLFTFAYVILYDLHMGFQLTEVISMSFVFGYILEELRQFVLVSKEFSPLAYLCDSTNWLDMTAITITCAGFIVRCYCLNDVVKTGYDEAVDENLFTARILLSTGYLIFSFRMILVFSIFQILGPKIQMIGDMLKKDLIPLLSIFFIFIIGFGVVFQGLLYPNGYDLVTVKNNVYGNLTEINRLKFGQTVLLLFRRAFYGILSGENTASQLECENQVCDESMGKFLVLYVYNVIYVLIVYILLVNLLIALFSNTVARIDQGSQALWLADRYKMIEEYKGRSIFPPPLNSISVIGELIFFAFNSCCTPSCCPNLKDSLCKSGVYINQVLIKFFTIQSFALKYRRNVLGGVLDEQPTSGYSRKSKDLHCELTKLEKKFTHLEESVTTISSRLDEIFKLQTRIQSSIKTKKL